MSHRRTFLATLGAGALGALSAGRAGALARALAPGTGVPRVAPLGVQLYTVRTAMQRDVVATLEQVAAIGYREVEFAGYHGRPPRELRALLDRLGLAAPSAHVPYDQLEGDAWKRVLDDAAVLGHAWVTVPWLPTEARRSVERWRDVAGRLNSAGREARAAGLRLAYHNHDFELARVGEVVPFDLLLAETDPALVEFELDVYWLVRAGGDPLAYFAGHPGRFPMLHLKDSAGPPDHRMTEVGSGSIDFPRLLAARAQGGVRHLFVEHDNPADPLASIRASHAYLARLSS